MSGARILLKNTATKRYLGRGGTWTDKPEAAMAFLDEVRAKDHSIYHRLSNTQVVVLAENGPASTPPPTPVTVNKTPMQEEPIMKTTKTKSRFPKQALTKVNRVQLMEERLLPHQISEVRGNHQTTNPATIGNQNAKTPALTEVATIIEAKIDVGFGNSLFIRGQGAELSWDKGQPLNCIDGTTWMWSTTEAKAKLVFKLVLNDVVWASGEDLVLEPGKKIQVVPKFQ